MSNVMASMFNLRDLEIELKGVTILRGKKVGKHSEKYGRILVPTCLIGQKVKVMIMPENGEIGCLMEELNRKQNEIAKLKKEIAKPNEK